MSIPPYARVINRAQQMALRLVAKVRGTPALDDTKYELVRESNDVYMLTRNEMNLRVKMTRVRDPEAVREWMERGRSHSIKTQAAK